MTEIIAPTSSTTNRILVRFKREPLKPWVEKTVHQFSKAAKLITQNPKSAAKAFGCSIGASCCELTAFCLVGYSFGVSVPQSLICGYVVATLFAMVSITPQGVGFVEAAVTVAFTAFGCSAAAGMAIGLVYRGIVFWMPFLIGAVLIQTTKTFHPTKKEKPKGKPKNLNTQREKEAALIARKSRNAHQQDAHEEHDAHNHDTHEEHE